VGETNGRNHLRGDKTNYHLGNNDSADDVKNVDLTKIHYLSGPFEVETAEPGDVLLVEIMVSTHTTSMIAATEL
jgi:acetamidase/formamidase